MWRELPKTLRALIGILIGYSAYLVFVVFKFLNEQEAGRYVDRMDVFANCILPFPAIVIIGTGNWKKYPSWVLLQSVLAYFLMFLGLWLALRGKKTENKSN